MSIIKNNTSSPFKMKYSSPINQAAAQVSYEFPSTQATHGSNSGIVAAISGIGKIAGQAIGAGRAAEGLKEAEGLKADINETGKGEKSFSNEFNKVKESVGIIQKNPITAPSSKGKKKSILSEEKYPGIFGSLTGE